MTYDTWKTRAPEFDDECPQACPVCTGDEDATPCTEACFIAVRAQRIERLYKASHKALTFAKQYKMAGYESHHITAIVSQVADYRRRIAQLRSTREAA